MYVATVTPFLNDIEQVDEWNINTNSLEKILIVQTTDNRIRNLIVRTMEEVGYQEDPIQFL